jgi:hypothetical protein
VLFRSFYIDKLLGIGGGSFVFKSNITEKNDNMGLYYGMDIAIKLCNPLLTHEGCKLLEDEVTYTKIFNKMNEKNVCYNYPLCYGFFHSCLFFTSEETDFIMKYIEENKIVKGVDAFIIYCASPKNTSIKKEIIGCLLNHYPSSFLIKSREIFPKTNNPLGIYLLSKRIQVYVDWDNNDNLYEYLDLQRDIDCDMFILLEYLEGDTLLELIDFKFTDSIFFEFIYSIICSIKILNLMQVDIQQSNAMIVKNKEPRIYCYKENYYLITGDMFYWIDFQGLNTILFISKSSIKFMNRFTEDQKMLIDMIFKETEYPNINYFLDMLFGWISNRVQVMKKEEADHYMTIHYDYKLINTTQLIT